MSPLLYQLSYTARAAKLTTYEGRVKRGIATVPEIVPVTHLARGVLQVGRGDDVIAIEHGACPMPRDFHAYHFRYTGSDEVSCSGPSQIMTQHPGESCRLARAGPAFSKVSYALPLVSPLREVWKEIGDDLPECPGQRADSFDLFFHQSLYVG